MKKKDEGAVLAGQFYRAATRPGLDARQEEALAVAKPQFAVKDHWSVVGANGNERVPADLSAEKLDARDPVPLECRGISALGNKAQSVGCDLDIDITTGIIAQEGIAHRRYSSSSSWSGYCGGAFPTLDRSFG